jgi:hypothetical protein
MGQGAKKILISQSIGHVDQILSDGHPGMRFRASSRSRRVWNVVTMSFWNTGTFDISKANVCAPMFWNRRANLAKAVESYERSADTENARRMRSLSAWYERGDGLSR